MSLTGDDGNDRTAPSGVMLVYRPRFINHPSPSSSGGQTPKDSDTVTTVDDTVAAADEEVASDDGIDYSSFSEYVCSQ